MNLRFLGIGANKKPVYTFEIFGKPMNKRDALRQACKYVNQLLDLKPADAITDEQIDGVPESDIGAMIKEIKEIAKKYEARLKAGK